MLPGEARDGVLHDQVPPNLYFDISIANEMEVRKRILGFKSKKMQRCTSGQKDGQIGGCFEK